jgi:hypothetical protein
MDKEHKRMQVEGWLKLIDRTRLFCNTADELEKLVGFSVSNRNSLARKGGNSLFMKEAIFHQLGYICHELTGMDLQELVEAYEDVDNFIDRYANLLRPDDVLPSIVDMFYGSGAVPGDLAFVKKRLDEPHIPILFLMLTGGLPRLSAKNGDVTTIKEDYRRSFTLLRESCKNVPMQELPAISIMESEAKAHPTKKNRLHLIHIVSFILNAYGAVSTQQRLSLTNRELGWRRFDPELDGIWTEDDSFTAFWCFEEVNNGYHLYHYKLMNEQRELSYTRYFISFYQDDNDSIEAVVVHPRSIRYIIGGQPIPNILFAYFNCQVSDEEIALTSKDDSSEWFGLRHLIRSSHAKYFQKILSDDGRTKINECSDADYNFDCCLAALTPSHIFMDCSQGGYYKIPKSLNDVLYDVQFGDNVGVITFEGSTYIAFDDKSLYYDVTTGEKMRDSGIEVVDAIA